MNITIIAAKIILIPALLLFLAEFFSFRKKNIEGWTLALHKFLVIHLNYNYGLLLYATPVHISSFSSFEGDKININQL